MLVCQTINNPEGICIHQSYFDYPLFTLQRKDIWLNVLVCVDDLIISGNDHKAIVKFKSYLNECFYMKNLGVLKFFLGVNVAVGSIYDVILYPFFT